MKVTKEKVENCQAFLTVELEAEEVEHAMAAAYQRIVKKAKIPGFRKGKAPRDVVERLMGVESILDEALQKLVPDSYDQAIQEQELQPVAPPKLELTQTEPTVIFKAEVPLAPNVELGDISGIKVAPEIIEVDEERIDTVLEEVRHQHATWEPASRAVADGDLVVMDVTGTDDGKEFIKQEKASYYVREANRMPVPGFSGELVGMSAGETKEFTLKVPEDDSRPELSGKDVSFNVGIAEVKEEKLPELDDEFARVVNEETKTMPELREHIRATMTQRAEERARLEYEEKVVLAAAAASVVEFPDVMVHSEVHHLIEEQARRMQLDQKAFTQYMKATNKSEEQLHEELEPIAKKRVTATLLVEQVAQAEDIVVSDEDIDSETGNMVNSSQAENKEELNQFLSRPQAREQIRQMLRSRKAVEKLVGIARANHEAADKPAGKKAAAKKPAARKPAVKKEKES